MASRAGAATHLRALSERRVGDGAERLVERAELPADVEETLLRLEAVVDPLELLDDPVQPLEQCVDLAVTESAALHGRNSTRAVALRRFAPLVIVRRIYRARAVGDE